MARIISIVNQKGGTGKSACTANLAVGLAQKNMKVLIVDADPQSDVSAGFGYRDCDDSNETLTALMDAVMKDEDIPSECFIRHQAEGIDIICSNIGLAGTEVQLVNAMSREYVLKQILYGIKDQYDVVIIDCMPSLGMITINALAASDEVLIPVEASYLPIKGLQQLLKTIGKVRKQINPKLQEEKNSVSYDVLEMSGSRAVWKEVLAVYSVKTNTDQDNPQEVATMDDGKKQLLKDIFWEMNQISSRTESKTETVITETDDGHGNIVETESTVTQTYLYITVSHKTAEEMAAQYGFNEEQKGYLAELLADENNYLWSQVLYGITGGDGQIVTVALSLVGNVGGQPYWSWYGFNSRVEWCACFVSWCANECGYIDAGVIPKYAGCVNGVQWFKDRGQWLDGSAEPAPGMIIFFDWADESGQDGLSDHTGIVQKVENGKVYTVEGNSGDSCRVNEYSIGYYEILGYGAPAY